MAYVYSIVACYNIIAKQIIMPGRKFRVVRNANRECRNNSKVNALYSGCSFEYLICLS